MPSPALSRRSFFRVTAGATALSALPILSEAHLAYAQRHVRLGDTTQGVHIDSNENPLGPSESARRAMQEMIPQGGRYFFSMEDDLGKLFAKQENIDPSFVRAYAGSSEPLAYTVLAFTSRTKPLVIADTTYEAPVWAAKTVGNPVIPVPLSDPGGASAHDIRAMLAASPTPGVFYICNPNNPTGTCTPRADLEHAVEHAPKDSVLLIDEAYIHFCDQPHSLDFVRQGKNVIVLRTFSKLYGMAGIRMGFAVGRPDLLEKLDVYGRNPLPITAMAGAKASLLDADLVATRQKTIAVTRTQTMSWLKKQGYAVTPSESNCFMLDTRRPGKEVIAAMAARNVYIGRIWPTYPNQVRITVGTPQEMHAFQKAFTEVMSTNTAGLELPTAPASTRMPLLS